MSMDDLDVGQEWEDEGMTHDPLCPNFRLEDDCDCKPRNGEHDMRCACWDCECDIIAKVRADEQQQVARRL